MRVGTNPNKINDIITSNYFHQVIIPVYIPNQEGYFKDAFEILKLCLESLFKTSHSKTFFTIVNNGSCNEVKDFLDYLLFENKVQEVIHTTNIGKINAIFKGVMGHNFDYVTITDADVLFLNNWQQKTNEVFINFPNSGVVEIVPLIEMYHYLSENTIFLSFLKRKLKSHPIEDEVSLKIFFESIGRLYDCTPDRIKNNLIIKNKSNNFRSYVGAAHFVATYRGDVFDEIKKYDNFKMGGTGIRYLDELAYNKNLWRLTTIDNLAYHMGNVPEPWMYDILQNQTVNNSSYGLVFSSKFTPKKKYILYTLLNFLIKRFLIKRIHTFVQKDKSNE